MITGKRAYIPCDSIEMGMFSCQRVVRFTVSGKQYCRYMHQSWVKGNSVVLNYEGGCAIMPPDQYNKCVRVRVNERSLNIIPRIGRGR